jgi:simple sugar transport system permease protein
MDRRKYLLNRVAGVVLILSLSLLFMVVIVFMLSKSPLKTIAYLFLGPLKNTYYFGNMLNNAVPLVVGGLGICIAMEAGKFNLGGEGQIYAGALIATIAALALEPLGIFGAALALIAGAAFSGIAAGLSGVFKAWWNTSEIITTFLLSNAIVLITNFLVTGPFQDTHTNLQSTMKIPEAFRFAKILPPSNLSADLVIALVLVLLVRFFLRHTRTGYEIRITGTNEMFARYGGINTKGITIFSLGMSGALYGLAGGLTIFGTYYGTIKGFSSGMGWNGLAVALIANKNPVFVIPAAIFFAWLGQSSRIAMQLSDVTTEISLVAESIIYFLITSSVLLNFFVRKRGPGL